MLKRTIFSLQIHRHRPTHRKHKRAPMKYAENDWICARYVNNGGVSLAKPAVCCIFYVLFHMGWVGNNDDRADHLLLCNGDSLSLSLIHSRKGQRGNAPTAGLLKGNRVEIVSLELSFTIHAALSRSLSLRYASLKDAFVRQHVSKIFTVLVRVSFHVST